MSLYEYKTNLQYGVINTTKTGKVTSWEEKPEIKANINMGCYVMDPKILKYIPKNKSYGMDNLIKKAMNNGKLISGFITKKGFMDIGNNESYKHANEEFAKKSKKRKK